MVCTRDNVTEIVLERYTCRESRESVEKGNLIRCSLPGSGCGSIGRAVASNIRDPQFKSRHRQKFIYQLYNRKDEIKKKEAGNGPWSQKVFCSEIAILQAYETFSSSIGE